MIAYFLSSSGIQVIDEENVFTLSSEDERFAWVVQSCLTQNLDQLRGAIEHRYPEMPHGNFVIEIEQEGEWIVLESLDVGSDALEFAIDYFLNHTDFSKLRVCSENGKIEYELVRP